MNNQTKGLMQGVRNHLVLGYLSLLLGPNQTQLMLNLRKWEADQQMLELENQCLKAMSISDVGSKKKRKRKKKKEGLP